MELLKLYFLVMLLIACVIAYPSAEASHKLKPGHKSKNKANDVPLKSEPALNRARRQFGGGGFGLSNSYANANSGSFSGGYGGGGSPFGFNPYGGGGGFGSGSSFASANAGSSSFGGR